MADDDEHTQAVDLPAEPSHEAASGGSDGLAVHEDVVASARRMYGRGGAILAAGMLGLDKVLHDKKKTESVQVQEASSDPVDVDTDGIDVPVDDHMSVRAPALERKPPVLRVRRKRFGR